MTRKIKKKTDRKKSKVIMPEIFVRIGMDNAWGQQHPIYARAHIHVKGGEYQYLQWRDGDRPRFLYLGRKRARK